MTDDWSGRYLGASWIGNGTAAGLATAACLQAATQPTAATGDFDGCVVNACPADQRRDVDRGALPGQQGPRPVPDRVRRHDRHGGVPRLRRGAVHARDDDAGRTVCP